MKTERHQKILQIISENDVETQEELLLYLKQSGYNATQATISRDIKELGLSKRPSKNGMVRYVKAEISDTKTSVKYEAILKESIISIDYAINTVVVKCHTGLANAACAAIDACGFAGIVGTIAGDDTIFILARSEEKAAGLAKMLKETY